MNIRSESLKYILFVLLMWMFLDKTIYVYSDLTTIKLDPFYKESKSYLEKQNKFVTSDIIMASSDGNGKIKSVIFSGKEYAILIELAKKWNDNKKVEDFLDLAYEKTKEEFMLMAKAEVKRYSLARIK